MVRSNEIFIFDFDSTFIQVETLDVLAEVSLANYPESEKTACLKQITEITLQAMAGRYGYEESLRDRVGLLKLTVSHLQQTIDILKHKITPSFARNKSFFKKNADRIFIFSGAFIEIIWPIVQPFGLKREQVFGNRLIYDFEQNILGYDQQGVLAQNQGKVKLAQQLHLRDTAINKVIIIGDGYTDYEVKEAGIAGAFFAFTENITRESVVEKADAVIPTLEGLFLSCNLPFTVSPKKVLLLENIHSQVVEYFKQSGYEVTHVDSSLAGAALKKALEGVHIVGIRSKTELKSDLLSQCPSLEAIGAFCIGTNQIDLHSCSEQGIAVFNAPFSNTRSVVELALSEIILLVRRAAGANHQLREGNWRKSSQNAHEVRGKTLGIIGYGNIGSQLSILAEALGMQVLFYDIEDKLPLGNTKACPSLAALLTASDVVTVHVDGRKENTHLINQAAFDSMKNGVIFLNLSRGSVVDYSALEHAISTGKIAGLGIDVFPEEPSEAKSTFSTPLMRLDNAIITPHIGGSTEEAQLNIGEYVSKNLHAYAQAGTSSGSVNFPQLSLPSINSPIRIVHIHKNVPGILAQINRLFAEYDSNIEGQFLKTNPQIGYVITDLDRTIEDHLQEKLSAIPHTIKVKILNKPTF